MWSFVKSKQQRWLWWAIDYASGQALAYVLATHEDEAFLQLKALLEPFGVMQFSSDVGRLMSDISARCFIPLASDILRRLNGNI